MYALAETGRVVGGRYRLRDAIGHGAMGTVWRARDELLDRDVAVKELKVPRALSEHDRRALCERTFREAKTAARLSHPGVVRVFDVVEEDSRPWIVMELVRARSLDRVLAEDGPLPPQRAADVGQQLVGALATAHAAGVLHRDVKPSNVLLTPDGRAVLTDFGIATFEGDARLTLTGMVMGTPAFTSPERIRGEPATPSSDLWSLGATLYAAVQGRGPYQERGGAITTMNAVINEDAPAASSAGQLGPVIAALLHRDPAARPNAATAALLLSGADGLYSAPVSDAPPYLPGGEAPPFPSYPPPASGPRHDAQMGEAPPFPSDPPPASGPRYDAQMGGAPPQHGSADPTHPGFPRSGRPARGVMLAAGAIGVIVAAGILGGVAVARNSNSPAAGTRDRQTAKAALPAGRPANPSGTAAGTGTTALPAGYTWYAQSAASTGTTAGFRLAVPQGWNVSRNGLTSYIRAPAGGGFMEVDLTPHTFPGMMAEARWLQAQTRRQGSFPGYRRISVRPVQVLGSRGVVWTFSWLEAGVGRVIAQDYLFDLSTANGSQSYALYGSAPLASWRLGKQILDEALSTFRPLT